MQLEFDYEFQIERGIDITDESYTFIAYEDEILDGLLYMYSNPTSTPKERVKQVIAEMLDDAQIKELLEEKNVDSLDKVFLTCIEVEPKELLQEVLGDPSYYISISSHAEDDLKEYFRDDAYWQCKENQF